MKVLVVDQGLYVELAITLGRSGLFDKVGYYTRWEEDFPYTKDAVIGAGFDEIEREMDLFTALTKYDAFVFPDNYWGGLQKYLSDFDVPVWGSQQHEELELDRLMLRSEMREYKLPVPNYSISKGLPELLESGLDEGDFIKINRYRGLMETTKFEGWDSPDWLWDVAKDLGPFAHHFPFIVEKPLEGVEIGFDSIMVRGEYLHPWLLGIEKKDAGYLGQVVDTLPERQNAVAMGIQSMVDESYSNFLSVELRGPVLIDLTTRMPQPPGHGILSLYKELPLLIYEHLKGLSTTTPLTPLGNWLSMIVLKRTHNDRYMKVTLEGSAKKYAKFSRMFKYNGELWVSPGKANEIGTVTGMGPDPREAQRMALEALKGVNADDLHTTGALDGFKELHDEWEQAEKEGAV